MKPQVIFEDDDILVINKPYGMVVNKADTTRYVETIQQWAETKIQDPRSKITSSESEFVKRGGVVHRLDKETSGVLILAKNEQSFTNLQAQFKNRTVKKTYITLVHGRVEPVEGEIVASIARLPWNRTRFGVLADGREAASKYKVISNFQNPNHKSKKKDEFETLSLVEVYPATGRTHQIRVHMKHINHPVFADELYAGRKTARDDRKFLPRQFLHASKIMFNHPVSGASLTFESELPEELSKLLQTLK